MAILKTKKIKGFTLVEILITISVLAILLTIGLAYVLPQFRKGNDAKRKANLNRIQIALEEYERDFECYPSTLTCPSDAQLASYLDPVPCDPTTDDPYYYEVEAGSCPGWYRLYADLENTADPIIKELGCDAGCGPFGANYYVGSPNAPLP